MTRPRRLATPVRLAVEADEHGRPLVVAGREVDAIRESWLIEDRWWTQNPMRRRYWELVCTDGRNEVVFRDLRSGRWWQQRG